jgi:hypothetical protein
MTLENYDWDRLAGLYPTDFIEKMKDDPCWKGYAMLGNKKKGGKQVPNCVKIDSKHSEGDIATAEMTPNFLPKKDIPGGGDLKNPQMSEQKLRMPRMEEIKKASNRNSHLAMAAAPNYSPTDDRFRERPGARRMRERQEHNRKHGTSYSEDNHDAFHSDEPNAAMIITQLRVIREKADIMLGMLYPDDNLEPWIATKIANAGVALASAADYLRFGGET